MRTFATIPPYTDISKIKHAARAASKTQGDAHAKALDRAALEATGRDWSQLHPDRTASILDTGKLVMQWHGVTLELGLVDKILPSGREEVPIGFDILLQQHLSMDDDVYELGRAVVTVICGRGDYLPGSLIEFSDAEIDRLVSSSEPLRVRCGILAGAVRTTLEKLYAEVPDPEHDGGIQAVRRNAGLHRQSAYDLAHDIRAADGEFSARELQTIARTFTGIAPACALAWTQLMGAASSQEERVSLLMRAVAFGEAVYGPLPVSLFRSDSEELDWRAVMDFLILRRTLGGVVKANQDPAGQNILRGLEEEISRVGALLAAEEEAFEAWREETFSEFRAAAKEGDPDDPPAEDKGHDRDPRST